MKINWKVRVKNPLFWVEIGAAILLPILAYLGLSWEDMTSWAALGEVLLSAIQNPVIVVASAVSVWNAITDPTTKGVSDSEQALTYTKPKE
jgi:phi LC3 family holin